MSWEFEHETFDMQVKALAMKESGLPKQLNFAPLTRTEPSSVSLYLTSMYGKLHIGSLYHNLINYNKHSCFMLHQPNIYIHIINCFIIYVQLYGAVQQKISYDIDTII